MSSATVLKASYLFYIPCYITTFSFALSGFLSHDLVSCALLCSFYWHWFMFTSLFIDIVIVYCAILSFCLCTSSAPSCSAYSNNQGTFGNVFALLWCIVQYVQFLTMSTVLHCVIVIVIQQPADLPFERSAIFKHEYCYSFCLILCIVQTVCIAHWLLLLFLFNIAVCAMLGN